MRRLADVGDARPYLYPYQVEDILSWACTKPDEPSEFQAVLLRDTVMDYDQATMLPFQKFQRMRLLWINPDTGLVNLQFYSTDGDPIDRDGNPGGPIELELTRIPFVMLDITDSLLKDICNHQIALLNLLSSDVNFALKANFPFYIEQRDIRAVGSHLKQAANPDGTATAGGQTAHDNEITIGATRGRAYDIKANPPAFINPSSDPLKASMDLREEIVQEINRLVNLGVESLVGKMPAGTQALDSGGLEAGLSYIGLVLESAERKIAEFWAAYEDRVVARRKIATIKYPDRYSLKTDKDRIDEATSLSKLMSSVPGQTVKREISKSITQALLGGKVSVETIAKVNAEIDESVYTTSDPDYDPGGRGSWTMRRADRLDGPWFQQGGTHPGQEGSCGAGCPRGSGAGQRQGIEQFNGRRSGRSRGAGPVGESPVRHGKKRNRVGTAPYTTANVGAFEAKALTIRGTRPNEYHARIGRHDFVVGHGGADAASKPIVAAGTPARRTRAFDVRAATANTIVIYVGPRERHRRRRDIRCRPARNLTFRSKTHRRFTWSPRRLSNCQQTVTLAGQIAGDTFTLTFDGADDCSDRRERQRGYGAGGPTSA